MAAADQPRGYLGRTAVTVRAAGWSGGRLYLNSEEDYRDPRNLSIVIHPEIANDVLKALGGSLEVATKRKLVVATGRVQRVRVDFLDDQQRPTGKYYYQAHLPITTVSQLRIVDLN